MTIWGWLKIYHPLDLGRNNIGIQKRKHTWNKNKKGLQVAWNKNIPRTEAEKEKMSRNRKGKCCGKDNHNYGKHPIPWNKDIPCTEETKAKISKTLTGRYLGEDSPNFGKTGEKNPLFGTKLKPETIEKIREKSYGKNNPFYGHEHSEEQKAKWSEDRTGSNHPHWIDGRSYEPYPMAWTRLLRESIRLRDNYICQRCGKTEKEENEVLSVHHIDYDKNNCNPTNLITLCRSCNAKVNFDRKYWQQIFENKRGGMK